MAQRTELNRPYGLKHEDDIVRDITELYSTASTTTTKVIEIGNWSLEGAFPLNALVAHGLSATEWKTIRTLSLVIRDDNDLYYNISPFPFPADDPKINVIDSTNITLVVNTGNTFDTVDYNNASSYNRGWITITYTAD